MRTRIGWSRLLPLVVGLLVLVASAALPVGAADWMTKGGTLQRRSVASEPVGLMSMEEAWRVKVGESATQPVVVGRTIYHLAGAYLWRMEVDAYGRLMAGPTALGNGGEGSPMPVNVPEYGEYVLSQSTPTYSRDSNVLYFGTGFGLLWAYYINEGLFRPITLERGCPIVGSPLVLRDGATEFVVVADRPNFPGVQLRMGQPACTRNHGMVWVVSGFDRPYNVPNKQEYVAQHSKAAEGGFGGFITPSAVPGPVLPEGPTLLIGADGFEGGRAIRLVLNRDEGYRPKYTWWVDGPSGFAGNFVSDGDNAYWLDTRGWLWGVSLEWKAPPASWPGFEIDLPSAIGASVAFTNTEPVVEERDDGSHLYITLRNYTYAGGPALRQEPTGSDGAVVAVGPQGKVKWYRKFGPTERDTAGRMVSINTTALAIPSSETLLFGDVNGFLYSQALDSANRTGGHPQPFLMARPGAAPEAKLPLLEGLEEPARGWATFSQVSGVGVDPAMANRLVLVGVNYFLDGQTGGRLVAYRLGPAYNLAWQGSPAGEPLRLKAGQPVIIDQHRVGMQLFAPADEPLPDTLAQLCEATLAVQWYVTGPGGYVRKLWPEVALPGGLADGRSEPSGMEVTLEARDPDEGQIVGIIDHPGVMALAGAHPANPAVQEAVRIGQTAGVQPGLTCRHASEILRPPGAGGPLSGLADNLLVIPYRKGTVVDDAMVIDVVAPPIKVGPGPLKVRVALGYRNNTGAEEVEVEVRVWARRYPEAEAPENWRRITLPRLQPGGQPTIHESTFEYAPVGTWEVIAEVRYPPDTDGRNNWKSVQVEVIEPPEQPEPGAGSSLGG